MAAGLAAQDPIEGYEIDVLTDPRPADQERILALDWTRHALRLAEMSDTEFLAAFGSELTRLVAARPDLSAAEHARSILAMHRTHGHGVKTALSEAIALHSTAIVAQTLDPTSLLRMIVAEKTSLPSPTATPPVPFVQENSLTLSDASLDPVKVFISGSAQSARVVVQGLGEVSGANATPVWALKPYHDADRGSELERHAYQFVSSGTLSAALIVSKEVVRQRVRRIRNDLAELFEAIEGSKPSQPILVQSNNGHNYRLDPECEIESDPPPVVHPG